MGIYSLIPVENKEQVKKLLPYIDDCIVKALSKAPEHTYKSVLRDILKGKSLLWVCLNNGSVVGVVTTKILIYPAKKTLLIHLLGGAEIEEWVGQIRKIEKVAKYNGCSSVEIHGRPAWKKLLPKYKTERIILSKEL